MASSDPDPFPTRHTMPLIALCLLATVPCTEAVSLEVSVSFFIPTSPACILLYVLSIAAIIALVLVLVFAVKKFLKRVLGKKKKGKKPQTEIIPPQPIALVPEQEEEAVEAKPTQEEVEQHFYEFIKEWNRHSLKDREEFIEDAIGEFPGAVTPSMVLDLLQLLLKVELHTDVWIPMLRLTMMLERDLFHWDQTRMEHVPEGDKTIPSQTHQRFQAFLVAQAEEILHKYGDVAMQGEEGETGFMRLIAFLFGFVCKDQRILDVMEDTWKKFGFAQTDASRAVVWGYRRWTDDPRPRVPGRQTDVECNDNHDMFFKLMRELRSVRPVPRLEEGSKAQHLLFALGCGMERDWIEGPLAHMSDHKHYPETKYFYGVDYLWLIMGRDLMRGSAWQWMCKKDLSEHDRMCNRFGLGGKLYEHVVNTVMKYEADYCVEDGQCLMSYAARYSPDIVEKINFGEHRAWYERYQRSKKAIGYGINTWLLKNDKQNLAPHISKDPANAVDHYTKLALQWEASKKNRDESSDSDGGSV